jgi:hypothetical protein
MDADFDLYHFPSKTLHIVRDGRHIESREVPCCPFICFNWERKVAVEPWPEDVDWIQMTLDFPSASIQLCNEQFSKAERDKFKKLIPVLDINKIKEF